MTMIGARLPSSGTGSLLGRGRGRRSASALAGLLHFLERRPACGWNRPPRKLYGDDRRGTLDEADQADTEAVIVFRFGVVNLRHPSRQGAEQAVAEQDAQESPHPARRYLTTHPPPPPHHP